MKKHDLTFALCCAAFWGLFAVITPLREWFFTMSAYKDWHYLLMAFLKFGILATLGEMAGLRIVKGVYFYSGFGIAPRAVVWGLLGMCIAAVMNIFAVGVPVFLSGFGVDISPQAGFLSQLAAAFGISVVMNSIFAPVFMTAHKITDLHILACGGSLKRFFTHRIDMVSSFERINWKVQWNFVFLKTIPFFWIPAHTFTFMLPGEYRVLFAALLGVVLGIILSVAAKK